MARLGDICYKITDGSHNPPNGVPNSEFLMLSSKNIYDDCITYDDPRYLSGDDFEAENRRTQIKSGDILLTIVGTVGRVAVVPENIGNICLQRSVAVIKPKTDIVLPRFLMYQLQSMKELLEKEAKGVAQKGIYLTQVENLPIKTFEYDIQKTIVSHLDDVCNLISLRKQQLSKLDELVKSRFVELFEKEEYKKVTVSSVLNTGFWLMPATPEFMVDGEVPYITSKNIKNRTIDFDNVKYISREVYKSISFNRPTQKGDILISMIGTLGQTAVIQDDREFYGQNLYLLRLNNAIVNTTYFCEFFNSDTAQYKLQGKRNQSTQAYLKANHVEDLILPLPPMKLQEQFAVFVEQTDKSKFEIQKSLEKLETLKKALMQKYFG